MAISNLKWPINPKIANKNNLDPAPDWETYKCEVNAQYIGKFSTIFNVLKIIF